MESKPHFSLSWQEALGYFARERGKATWHSPADHEWLWHFLFTIYDSLFTALIGSDRSAFAAGRHKVAGQSKTKESSVCSIHDEGLLEHPIKN
jgi:hypothetical protein